MRIFADSGYVGISVGYRSAPTFQWPSQIHDAKAAIRYVQAHAGEFAYTLIELGLMGNRLVSI